MKRLFNYISLYHKTFVLLPLDVLENFSTFLKLLQIKLLTESCAQPFQIVTSKS